MGNKDIMAIDLPPRTHALRMDAAGSTSPRTIAPGPSTISHSAEPRLRVTGTSFGAQSLPFPSHVPANQVPHFRKLWPLSRTLPNHRSTSSASPHSSQESKNATVHSPKAHRMTRHTLAVLPAQKGPPSPCTPSGSAPRRVQAVLGSPCTLRSNTPGVIGIQRTASVKVEDPDDWGF